MSDPNHNRDGVLRHSFTRTAWIVIGVVVAIIVVIGLFISSSSDDGDRSSAVRNESPQAELNR